MKRMGWLDFMLSTGFFMAVAMMFVVVVVLFIVVPLAFVGHVIGLIF